MEDTLRRNIQRVLVKMEQDEQDPASERARMIEAVAEIQQSMGQTVDLDRIGQEVDEVLAAHAREVQEAEVAAQAEKARKASRIPLHIWLLCGVLAIPLMFPLARGLAGLIARLMRVVL